MARTSIARKIKFAHVARDGKTMVYNPTTKKWEYQLDPTAQQLTDASNRLLNIDDNAASAMSIAESKVDMEEVKSLFPCQVSGGEDMFISSLTFTKGESGGWTMYLCAAPLDKPAQQRCYTMGYALQSDYEALANRVATIEHLLGKT